MSTVEERKAIVIERMARREEEREATKEQRRLNLGMDLEQRGTMQRFFENLRVDGDALLGKLNESSLESKTLLEQKNVFSEVMDGIEAMSQRLQESTMFLPSYDIEQSRDLIHSLQTHLAAVREQLQPKKKFAFGGRRKNRAARAAPDEQQTKNGAEEKPKPPVSLGDYGAAGRTDEDIVLGETKGKDLFLSNLSGCAVRMAGGGSAMRIDGLQRCQVVCGPTSGSIFIENCADCVFVLACQQLRIHTTSRSDFYIHVTSKAIIEFCAQLRFAPYTVIVPDGDPSLEEQFAAANLNFLVNNWDKVDDFCHLAADVRSDNWREMPEEERKTWAL